MSEGFPVDHSVYARATGRVRALVLFVDFPDAPAQEGAERRYAEFFPAAQQWFTTSSYGKLRYEPHPVMKYYRMPRGFREYGIERGYGWRVHERMMRDLLRVADREVDFSRYDLVNVLVTPNAGPPAAQSVLSVTWTGATAAVTDDGARLDKVSVLYSHDAAGHRVLNHENGHIFGLPDLYAGHDFRRTDRWAGQWDMMSLDWGLHSDFLAWHKWKLGWLEPGQVGCVTRRGTTEHVLSPVEVPGGRKLVVVPARRTGAFALEVRSRQGNDRGGCSEGVLLYWLRTDVPSGQGPVRVLDANPATDACRSSSTSFNSHNDAPFAVGQSYHHEPTGTLVRVVAKDAQGRYTVRVTKG
jgi:M6 family metalloprotease-like protein